MPLPQETQQAIANRAAKYADQAHANDGDDIHIGFLDGATEWAEKAQGLLDALKLISEMKSFTDKEGFVKQIADRAIAKYEGKEVINGQ